MKKKPAIFRITPVSTYRAYTIISYGLGGAEDEGKPARPPARPWITVPFGELRIAMGTEKSPILTVPGRLNMLK